jgi:adenosylcobinamide-GDP ribazoletransferase
MPDALRLALGTFTALPVRPPRVVDRRVARGAMLVAPLAGLLLGGFAAVVLEAVRLSAGPRLSAHSVAVNLLAAALAVTVLALSTRAMHLDGLADTADGRGVVGDPLTRLEVMRRPDVGAFGVVAVVLVVLVQVAALTLCGVVGHGWVALVTAVVAGRLAATWATVGPVPGARPDGLGAAVAGSVPVPAAALATGGVLALVALLGATDDDATVRLCLTLVVATLLGLVAAALVVRRAVHDLGGITGDVIGAVVEVSTTTALVAIAVLG